MSTVLEPPRDANGIPILPGYRPPFTSETARKAGLATQAKLRAEREQYAKLGLNRKQRKPRNLLYAVMQAIVRHANASTDSTLSDYGTGHARNAKLFTDIYHSLNGNPPMAKHGYKPHLQKSAMVEPVAPIEPQNVSPQTSGNYASNPTTTHPASEKAVSPVTPNHKDDCPF